MISVFSKTGSASEFGLWFSITLIIIVTKFVNIIFLVKKRHVGCSIYIVLNEPLYLIFEKITFSI